MKEIIFKFVIILLISLQVSADNCNKLLRELGNAESSFAYCATDNSVPVTICRGCKNQYDYMSEHYAKLKNETNCTSIYFDNDRINLVAATEAALAALWTRAYCDDCFSSENGDIFDKKKITFDDCINEHRLEPCDKCMLQYSDLNNFYILLDQHNNGNVCFDLQDSMNRTRNKWSNELKCCRREFNMTLFTVALSIVTSLPFLFYGGTYLLTKRQERNHGILNDEDPLLNSAAPSTSRIAATTNNSSAPSSSSTLRTDLANPQPLATSSMATDRAKPYTKRFNKLNEEINSSSDEENLAAKKI